MPASQFLRVNDIYEFKCESITTFFFTKLRIHMHRSILSVAVGKVMVMGFKMSKSASKNIMDTCLFLKKAINSFCPCV